MTIIITTVCTGNVCRSPFMAARLARSLDDQFTIQSCGIAARPGMAAPAIAVDSASHHDVDLTRHRAVHLADSGLATSNLVLTSTRAHRSAVVSAVPRLARRTFTLREFARLAQCVPETALVSLACDSDPTARLESVLQLLRAERGQGAVTPLIDDIEDPFGRARSIYDAVWKDIVDATAVATAVLRHVSTRTRTRT